MLLILPAQIKINKKSETKNIAMETVTLARNAMNCRFELVLHGGNPVSLQAAGEAALAEIERIENQLSLFKPGSEIARVNALAAREPVRVSPEVFTLLAHAIRLGTETHGAFDITMAPLLRCWGLLGRSDGRLPDPAELDSARAVCGLSLLELDPARLTVRFKREGVMIDLGAIGKGYSVEKAAETLRESGVECALIHGGTSTACAIGTPPNVDAWKVAIEMPSANPPLPKTCSSGRESAPSALPGRSEPPHNGCGNPANQSASVGRPEARPLKPDAGHSPLATITLRDEALSVSAISGKCFVANGRTLGHIIDPRTGEPSAGARLAAVVLPSATESDALSTALLVSGLAGHAEISALRGRMRTLVVGETEAGVPRIAARGIELSHAATVR